MREMSREIMHEGDRTEEENKERRKKSHHTWRQEAERSKSIKKSKQKPETHRQTKQHILDTHRTPYTGHLP